MTFENQKRLKFIGVLMEHADTCPRCSTYLNGSIEEDVAPCNFGLMLFKIGRFAFYYTDDIPPSEVSLPLPQPSPFPELLKVETDA
jgi:hypothetical protein